MPPEIQELIFQQIFELPVCRLGSHGKSHEQWTQKINTILPVFLGSAKLKEATLRVLRNDCSLVQIKMIYKGENLHTDMGYIAAEMAKVPLSCIELGQPLFLKVSHQASLRLGFCVTSQSPPADIAPDESESDLEEYDIYPRCSRDQSLSETPVETAHNKDFKTTTALFAFEESGFRRVLTALNNFSWSPRWGFFEAEFTPPSVKLDAQFPIWGPSKASKITHKKMVEAMRYLRGLEAATFSINPSEYPINPLGVETTTSLWATEAVIGFFAQALIDSVMLMVDQRYESVLILCSRVLRRATDAQARLFRLKASQSWTNLLNILVSRLYLARCEAVNIYLNICARGGCLDTIDVRIFKEALQKYALRAANPVGVAKSVRATIHSERALIHDRYVDFCVGESVWRHSELAAKHAYLAIALGRNDDFLTEIKANHDELLGRVEGTKAKDADFVRMYRSTALDGRVIFSEEPQQDGEEPFWEGDGRKFEAFRDRGSWMIMNI